MYNGFLDAPAYRSDLENGLFSCYAMHTQELDDIVKQIASGEANIDLSHSLSQSDLAYIQNRLQKDYRMFGDLTIQ